MSAVDLALMRLEVQQAAVEERSPQWAVAEQLKEICRADPAAAEMIYQDLANEEMSITAAEKKIKAYVVTTYETFMSAAVVGKPHYLALTGWRVERRVDREAKESLVALPYEAYVFGQGTESAKLTGWCNSYSGTAGYFHALLHAWRQPQRWSESWGSETEIYGLTPELVESSCLPNCKLCEYMESWNNLSEKYPVPYLRLYQYHHNVEALLLHGLRNCAPPTQVKAFADLWISWVRAGSKRDKDGNPILPAKENRKGVA